MDMQLVNDMKARLLVSSAGQMQDLMEARMSRWMPSTCPRVTSGYP